MNQTSVLHQLYELEITTTIRRENIEILWEILAREEERDVAPRQIRREYIKKN